MATASTWGNMMNQKAVTPKQAPNYNLHHMEHVGSNPMFVQKVQKVFTPKPAKVKLNAPGSFGVGSPWEAMKGK